MAKYAKKKTAPRPKRKGRKSAPKPKRILNCLPSPKQEDDWTFDTALTAGLTAAPVALPASKDLREAWWKIGDQGSTGSCVGWATADAVLRWHFVKAGKLAKEETLSTRFIWMAAKETDEFTTRPTTFIETDGTSLKSALDIARKYGAVPDRVLPFLTGKLYQDRVDVFYALASRLKIASYINLGRNLTDWRSWLANNGPILTRLDVDDAWYNAKENNGNLDLYTRPARPAGHAVALVGYTPNRFIVRNSWGTTLWGDKGFGYASLAYAQAAFTEAYGVKL
ncbi:MAG: C1 family peptidase [Rhodospirillaceae bacterium]|jgi:C1A family cysteine protease|nr:C1 family peptidase [Rhodospirillaceae bacterium]